MKILVVDDSRAMLAYIRGVIKAKCRYSITEVTSGFEALRLLPREQFELVISDISMPDINGLELIRFIRESSHHKDVPILIISTRVSEQDRERIFELGANDFLAKPFQPDALVDIVVKLIGKVETGDATDKQS